MENDVCRSFAPIFSLPPLLSPSFLSLRRKEEKEKEREIKGKIGRQTERHRKRCEREGGRQIERDRRRGRCVGEKERGT